MEKNINEYMDDLSLQMLVDDRKKLGWNYETLDKIDLKNITEPNQKLKALFEKQLSLKDKYSEKGIKEVDLILDFDPKKLMSPDEFIEKLADTEELKYYIFTKDKK